MHVLNRHERTLPAPLPQVGQLIDSLASENDRLWPVHAWPRMRFDRPLGVGGVGGHGPIRYNVKEYEPGRRVVFQFTAPKGFDGTHRYDLEPAGDGGARLIHTLEMDTSGPALWSWPLVYRPLHDALIEDSLDCAERALLGRVAAPARWPAYVRLLRRLIGRRRRA